MAKVKRIEQSAVATVSIPANTPANSTIPVSFTIDPRAGSESIVNIPLTESWVIDDIYVDASQTPDGIVEFYKNLRNKVLVTPRINTLLVSNPSRPKPPKLVYEAGSKLSAFFVNAAAVGTGGATVTFHLKLVMFVKE